MFNLERPFEVFRLPFWDHVVPTFIQNDKIYFTRIKYDNPIILQNLFNISPAIPLWTASGLSMTKERSKFLGFLRPKSMAVAETVVFFCVKHFLQLWNVSSEVSSVLWDDLSCWIQNQSVLLDGVEFPIKVPSRLEEKNQLSNPLSWIKDQLREYHTLG